MNTTKQTNFTLQNYNDTEGIDLIRNLLKSDFLFAEDAVTYLEAGLECPSGKVHKLRGLKEAAHSKKKVIVETRDCVHSHHLLKNQGLKEIQEPYYLNDGLVCELHDGGQNFYLIRETRDYQFQRLV